MKTFSNLNEIISVDENLVVVGWKEGGSGESGDFSFP